MLTNSDLKQILDALARYGKKDSQLDTVPIDLEHPEGTFTTNDYLSIVQDGKNKTIKIKNLEKVFLLTFLTDEDFREALKGRIPGEMLENASVTTEKLADGTITTIKLGDSSVTNTKLSDNAVTSSKLADNSVTTSKIVDESVTTSKLNTKAVTTDKLADGSVTTDKIANGAVTSSKIADNSLSGANFGNNTIEGTKIKDNSIPGSKLADGAIESIDIKDGTLSGSKLADNSVTGAKLQDSVITGMKIADNSIPGSKIADSTIQNLNIANNSISGSKLVDNAITTDKIANDAINSAKLTNDAITENKIVDNSVTTNKIADRAVTNSKLANNSVTSDKIADNSITSSMITDYAVTENKLDSGSVTASKIAPNAVTTTKLGDNAITSDKIVDGSVTEQKLADESVTTDKIDTDAVTNVKIADNAVTESKIATNAITTAKIVDSSVTTVKIADNTITTVKLVDGAVTEEKLVDGAVTTAKLADGLISEIQNITDATPTEGSVKPVQSGGVKTAIDSVVASTDVKISSLKEEHDSIIKHFVELEQSVYKGCIFRVTGNVTSSYITKYHVYLSKASTDLNSSIYDRRCRPNLCSYGIVTVSDIDKVFITPKEDYVRFAFLTENVSAGNYVDITNVIIGGYANGIRTLTEASLVEVPEGAACMYVERIYKHPSQDAVDITPVVTIEDNYNIPSALEDLENSIEENADNIESNGIEINKTKDTIGNPFVEMPRIAKQGKQIYFENDSRLNLWYIVSAARYSLYIVKPGDILKITANENYAAIYAFLINDSNGNPHTISDTEFYDVNFAYENDKTYHSVAAGTTEEIIIPELSGEESLYLYVYDGRIPSYSMTPSFVGVSKNIIDRFSDGGSSDILDLFPRREIEPLLLSLLFKGRTSNTQSNFGCFTFAHIADCHGRDESIVCRDSWKRFIKFCTYYKKINPRYILEMVDTGDIVADSAAVADTPVTNNWRQDSKDILTVIGNHDVANKPTAGSDLVYSREGLPAYNQFLKDNISNWNVVQPEGAEENGYCYYYKDYEIGGGETAATDPTPHKLRAIFVDCMDWVINGSGNENYHQAIFVKNALDGALQEDTHVVIFTHVWPGSMLTLNTEWNRTPDAVVTSNIESGTRYQYLSVLVNKFQEAGGQFVAYICGHYHHGLIGRKTGILSYTESGETKTLNFDEAKTQLVICGMSANVGLGTSQSSALTWIKHSSDNQNCFRIISIDTTYKYIKLMQIGRNTTYQLKKKVPICITYNNYPQFDENTQYNKNEIVAKDGYLWRFIIPVINNNATDWNSSVKEIFNRIINK